MLQHRLRPLSKSEPWRTDHGDLVLSHHAPEFWRKGCNERRPRVAIASRMRSSLMKSPGRSEPGMPAPEKNSIHPRGNVVMRCTTHRTRNISAGPERFRSPRIADPSSTRRATRHHTVEATQTVAARRRSGKTEAVPIELLSSVESRNQLIDPRNFPICEKRLRRFHRGHKFCQFNDRSDTHLLHDGFSVMLGSPVADRQRPADFLAGRSGDE